MARIPESLHALLANLIDYAGLFPRRHGAAGRAFAGQLSRWTATYCEARIEAIEGGAFAKVSTGGLTPDAIPPQ